MKASLPCLSPFHVYSRKADEKLKAANAESTSDAQEENTGPRQALPEIYAGGKGRAHIIRDELQKSQAAKKIQAVWRGYTVRRDNAARAQEKTPYESLGQFQQAIHSFSLKNLQDWPFGTVRRKNRSKAEYKVYQSTNNIPSGQHAFLHSFQQREALKSALNSYNVIESDASANGSIYNPKPRGVSGSLKHDMKLNSIWLLGLAHHNKSAVLTTPLDDKNLIRRSAGAKSVEKMNTEHSFSALGREVLGMVQNGHFESQNDELRKMQVLIPTPKARLAKLDDLKTPSGMKKEEIKEKLADKGIDVSKITTSP